MDVRKCGQSFVNVLIYGRDVKTMAISTFCRFHKWFCWLGREL